MWSSVEVSLCAGYMYCIVLLCVVFLQAEDGIRDLVRSRGLGDVYKRQANNVAERQAAYIFDLMEKFAGYGFNKSHSAAYALLSYQTGWLKAHYPAAFMAAVLSADMDHTDNCLLYTSPSPRDRTRSRMPSSA